MGFKILTHVGLCTWLLLLGQLAQANSCDIQHLSDVQDLKFYGCEVEKMNSDCQTWFQNNPSTIEFAKDCSDPFFQARDSPRLDQVCREALGEAWSQIWKDLIESVRRNSDFLNACEADPELRCKRQLAKEALFKYTSDQQLVETNTLDLIRKRAQVLEMADRDPNYRKFASKNGLTLPSDSEPPAITVLSSIADQLLKRFEVKSQCYSRRGRMKMACYALGSVADPLLLAGGTGLALKSLKAGQWAERVLRVTQSGGAVARTLADSKWIVRLGKGLKESDKVLPGMYTQHLKELDQLRHMPSRSARELRRMKELKKITASSLISESLADTANKLDEIILVRAPNEAALSHIEQSVQLKPMTIKTHTAQQGLGAGLVLRTGDPAIENEIALGRLSAKNLESSQGIAVRDKGREFWTREVTGTQVPIQVVTTPNGRMIASDLDIVAVARKSPHSKPLVVEDSHLGFVTSADKRSIQSINSKFMEIDPRGNHRALVQHGPENIYPEAKVPTYPLTVYLPDRRVLKIERGPNADPNAYLRDLASQVKSWGYNVDFPKSWMVTP